ncbi:MULTISPECIES: NifU family protein [Bradyrhizobium]|uniref:NifU family protein n=1 Tax=Bradyrhizobium septentrionale TaxID=1404411 RepID=A0ABZ2NW85_9BRAD
MLAEPEQLRQLTAISTGRAGRIPAVIEEIRANLQRSGADYQLIGIDGSKIMVGATRACALFKLLRMTLEGVQVQLADRLVEFVRLITVVVAGKTRD